MTGNLNFFDELKQTKKQIVLYGAGVIGEMCSYAFKSKNIKIDYFIDTSVDKQSKKLHDIKILSPQILEKTDKDTNIFISNNYYSPLKKDLNEKNFKNVYDCSEILNSVESCDPRINESFSVKSNNGFPALHNTKSETLSIIGVGLYSTKIESLVAHSSPKTISTE